MQKTVDPAIGCMLSVRVIDNYDPWDMLSGIFSDYHLNELRQEFWHMYRAALLNDLIYPTRRDLCDLTFLYEHLSDLITSAYMIVSDKGLDVQEARPVIACFPNWERFEYDPWARITGILSAYEPYEIREMLWSMFQSAISKNGLDQTKEERRKLISLFEHLTDLVTAAYAIGQEFEKKQKDKPKK